MLCVEIYGKYALWYGPICIVVQTNIRLFEVF